MVRLGTLLRIAWQRRGGEERGGREEKVGRLGNLGRRKARAISQFSTVKKHHEYAAALNLKSGTKVG